MAESNPTSVDFGPLIGELAAGKVWEYQAAPPEPCVDVAVAAHDALQTPDDFPPLAAAIVTGDRVAVAVDPNVPQIDAVVRGVIKAIARTEAGAVDIVLWDEADEETLRLVSDEVGESATVDRHDSIHRDSLRYLGADAAADPVYLNRRLVDADFVLPIVAARPMDGWCGNDLTGVFPTLADSFSRQRDREARLSLGDAAASRQPPEFRWLLGVQLMVSVRPNSSGQVHGVHAGTLEAIGKRITPARRLPDGFPPPAPLVIASIDGGRQQQTWANVTRALFSASRFVSPGGTIVLWTDVDRPPIGELARLSEPSDSSQSFEPTEGNEFPPWDATAEMRQVLDRVSEEHRVLIHSRVNEELIESMGLGVIETVDQLTRLSESFDGCGVLRAAQFAGSTLISPVVPE